eukprot:2951923-Rhodomonas_salina.1
MALADYGSDNSVDEDEVVCIGSESPPQRTQPTSSPETAVKMTSPRHQNGTEVMGPAPKRAKLSSLSVDPGSVVIDLTSDAEQDTVRPAVCDDKQAGHPHSRSSSFEGGSRAQPESQASCTESFSAAKGKASLPHALPPPPQAPAQPKTATTCQDPEVLSNGLHPKQQYVFDLCMQGKNVFFSGPE